MTVDVYTTTYTPNLSAAANGGDFTGNHDELIGTLGNRIKAITGKTNVWDNPDTTLAALFGAPTWTVFQTFLEGLDLAWASPGTNHNNISVSPGACWIPGSGKIVNNPSTITPPSSTTLSASTVYYLYGYESSGVLALDPLSTTAPAVPYKGTACTKTGDTSRRYLGFIRTLASGAIAKFWDSNGQRHWLENLTIAPFLIYTGSNSAWTTISAAGVVPPTARIGRFQIANEGTAATYVYITEGDYNSATAGPVSAIANSGVVYPQTNVAREIQLNSSQQFGYFVTAGAVIYAFCLGYKERR